MKLFVNLAALFSTAYGLAANLFVIHSLIIADYQTEIYFDAKFSYSDGDCQNFEKTEFFGGATCRGFVAPNGAGAGSALFASTDGCGCELCDSSEVIHLYI
jgi:hypothetical protein